MDIYTQADTVLRQAGYRTRLIGSPSIDVLVFEDDVVIGFLRVFSTARHLIESWPVLERSDLSRSAPQFKAAPGKAWNIYSVFLTMGQALPADLGELSRIEENFEATRKIVMAGVESPPDLERAIMPLLALRTRTMLLSASDYRTKLRSHLSFLSPQLFDTILQQDSPQAVLRGATETS